MQTVRRFVTLLLAGVLALTPVVQPIAVYAEALGIGVDDEGDSTSTSSVGQQGAAESDSATASPDHSSTGSVEAPVDVDGESDDASADVDLETVQVPEFGDIPSSDESMAQSWRFENGVALVDEDGSSISMLGRDELPEGASAWGIDVSAAQGQIDWEKVKAGGVDFVILRLGYGSGGTDKKFSENVSACKRLGIKFGVYLYSYAWDAATAREEAQWTLSVLRSNNISPADLALPVYYDLENQDPSTGKPAGVDNKNNYREITGGPSTFAAMANAYCGTLVDSGYMSGVYANLRWWNNYLTDSVTFDQYERWVAQYNSSCDYAGSHSLWQYSSSGSVDGIAGRVDVNYMFGDITHITYRAHVSDIGWQDWVGDGATAGTTGRSKTIEAIQVELPVLSSSSLVSVRCHVRNIGWEDWGRGSGGTTGRALPIEAIQLKLNGPVEDNYDIWYRVHSSNVGWLGWAKNGESAGTQGYAYGVEAIQIKLVKKGANAPGSTTDAFIKKPVSLTYSAHVSDIGWQPYVSSGEIAGTTGRNLSVEALSFKLLNAGAGDAVKVRAHVRNIGWQDWMDNSGGTTGRALNIEALQLQLSDSLSSQYDLWYRVHVQDIGWLDWAKNGEVAGTTGMAKHVEAVQVIMQKKGASAPGPTDSPSVGLVSINYSSVSGSSSWGQTVQNGATSGTMGQDLPLHAIRVQLPTNVSGGVSYKTHLSNIGWGAACANGSASGDLSGAQEIEALSISLSGQAAKRYDVWYRVYIENFGWLGWTKNGSNAGSSGCGLHVEAYQVVIKAINSAAPGSTANSFCNGTSQLPYIGYQNPSQFYQVSNRSVTIKNMGQGIFGYRTESRIPYNATRNQIVNAIVTRALEYVGTPYIWDYSCAPGVGVDCAGLVMQALYAAGMDLSPMNPWDHYYSAGHDQYANYMRNYGRFQRVSFADRQPGDLILTNGHVSLYIGGDRIVEAYSPRVGTRVASAYSTTPILSVARPVV